MRNFGNYIFLALLLLVTFFLCWYVFQALKTIVGTWQNPILRTGVAITYWLVFSVYCVLVVSTFLTIFQEKNISSRSQMILNVFLTVSITQLTVILFLFGEDLFRLARGGVNFFSASSPEDGSLIPGRRLFVSHLALMVAAIPLYSFVYGMLKGKYNFKVFREVLYFDDLPDAFDGFTITQISDIHAGSFKDPDAVQKGIDLAIAQGSDLFVFTGDLVNHTADEIEPLLDRFRGIKAPYGQYSILGNHDYGDYISWSNPLDKASNFESLKKQHQKMGYKLLLDEHVTLEKDGEKLHLLGVENWGVGFKSKGNIDKALKGVQDKDFKILLSHDPSHWDKIIKNHPNKIHLTLSGHTHGMQMGVETPLFRWSPAQYRYPQWAGLTEQAGRFLYVNRGFGFHAFAGRVGIWPEVTVIKLKKSA